jgi:hypothetical protein
MSGKFIVPDASDPTYGLGICARCSRKFKIAELNPDPNFPALMVCKEDTDNYDPYRLAPRKEDQIVLPFVRPDVPVTTNPSGLITQDGTQFIVSEDGQRFLFVID